MTTTDTKATGWIGHMNAKGPALVATSDPSVARFLSRMSKAALADLAAQSIAALQGRCDDPITPDDLLMHATPVLLARGDTPPRIDR